MKKLFTVIAAFIMSMSFIGKIYAMPIPNYMDDSKRYIHEVMRGINDNELLSEDGHIFVVDGVDHIRPIEYEVCTDTYCTEIREDDEIIDFCPLDEVCETLFCVSFGDSGRELLVLEGDKEGYVYTISDDSPKLQYLELYYVTFNNHWTEDIKDDSIVKYYDLEVYEIMQMDVKGE